MAYANDRDERGNRNDWQRGDWRRNDDSRNWSRGSNDSDRDWERDRNWSQRSSGSHDERYLDRDDDMRLPLLGSSDRDTYGRSNRSYGEPYGNRGYRHGTGQGYGGEDQWNPGYGGQGAYGGPGSNTYGSNSYGGSGNYGGSNYGSSSGRSYGRDSGRDYERDSSRDYGRDYGSSARGMGYSGGPNQSGSGYGGGYSGSNYGTGSYSPTNYGTSSGNRGYGAGSYGSSSYGSSDTQYGSRYGRDQDSASMRSSHAGKGPKGYKRSDDRIKEDVCDRLSMDDDVDASDITVTVRNGEVTLDGSVETRRMKHRAEDIAEDVSGVTDIHNNVRVVKGFLNEMVDRVTGNEREQHFANSGTRNNPNGTTTSSSTTSTTTSGTSAQR